MSINGSDRPRSSERPIVSRATVLILAMLMIGMGLGAFLPAEQTGLCLLIGLFGLVAYVALEVAAFCRARQLESRRQRAADQHLYQRMRVEACLNRRHHDGKQTNETFDAVAPQ